jgi:polyphosphate glucokinase
VIQPPRQILVIDVGGSHIKVRMSGQRAPTKLPSGPSLTPGTMATLVKTATAKWTFDAVSIGYPGPVIDNRPANDPHNLGRGWVKYSFEDAFGPKVRIVNDAAMQALGGYRGGRMLFLGLGTGLGSALIVEGHLQPLELAHLPYRKDKTFEQYLGEASLEKRGQRRWERLVIDAVTRIRTAMQVDSVLIGGGNARLLAGVLGRLPPETRLGGNIDAYRGGLRLWSPAHERAAA